MTSVEALAARYSNQAHAGAFIRGAQARYHGKPRNTCPYTDHRSAKGNRLTWSKSFRAAWFAGYDAQMRSESEPSGKVVRS